MFKKLNISFHKNYALFPREKCPLFVDIFWIRVCKYYNMCSCCLFLINIGSYFSYCMFFPLNYTCCPSLPVLVDLAYYFKPPSRPLLACTYLYGQAKITCRLPFTFNVVCGRNKRRLRSDWWEDILAAKTLLCPSSQRAVAWGGGRHAF